MAVRTIERGRFISVLAALALGAMVFPTAARADELIIDTGTYDPRGRASLGLMLGGPTGLTFEQNLPSGNAWDAGLGVVYGPGLRLHADYLWTVAATAPGSEMFIRFQIGVGGLVGSLQHPCEFYGDFGTCNGSAYFGARVPFTVELWPRAPVNFGVQVAPVIAFNKDGAGGFLDAFAFARFVL